MGSYLRVNSIIYRGNFEVNVPCPWIYNVVATLNFLIIYSKFRIPNERESVLWLMSTSDVFDKNVLRNLMSIDFNLINFFCVNYFVYIHLE